MQNLVLGFKKDRQREKPKPIHKACQSDEKILKGSDKEIDKAIKFNSKLNLIAMQLVTVTKLDTRSSHKSAILKYKMDTGCDVNLVPADMFKYFFPKKKQYWKS